MTDLGLSGTTLVSCVVEYTAGLQFSGGHFVIIESPFTLEKAGNFGPIRLDPESDDPAVLRELDGFLGLVVVAATADTEGRLSIAFENEQLLTVEPDPGFEA